jgi:hypothetical protein
VSDMMGFLLDSLLAQTRGALVLDMTRRAGSDQSRNAKRTLQLGRGPQF